jgi:RND family efflux transporter MFP subunit
MSSGSLALLVLLALLPGCAKEAPEETVRPVRTMEVTHPSELAERAFPGQARAGNQVDMSFRVSGPLVERSVDRGDKVKKGDILARIDPRDFESEIQSVGGQLERARAALTRAQADYDRLIRVQQEDPGATSQSMVDLALAGRDQAQASVRSLEGTLKRSRDRLQDTYLRAPFDGEVVATYVENFEDVLPKQPVVRVLGKGRMEFDISVPENLISHAPYVESVVLRFDAFPGRELEGEVKEVGTEASAGTRTFPVTLAFDQPDDIKVLSGMAGEATVTARLPEDQAAAGIEVPVSAVFSPGEAGDSFVWIVDTTSNTVSKRQVEVGELTAFGIQVVSGLEPGETIATAGVNFLQEGQEVRIMTEADVEALR